MQRLNPAVTAEFAATARAFLARHWPPGADADGWYRVLAEQGWSAPHWALADGGQGWTPQQFGFWQNACISAGAPLPDTLTVSGIGPLLRSAQRPRSAQWVEQIQMLRERWCLVVADPVQASQDLELVPAGAQWRLRGQVQPVVHAMHSQWALCRVEQRCDGLTQPALVAVATSNPAVSLRGIAMIDEVSGGRPQDGLRMASMTFNDVAIAAQDIVCEGVEVLGWLDALAAFAPALDPQLSSAVAISGVLADLAVLRQDAGEVDEFDPLCAEFGVRLAALEVLEQRLLALSAGTARPPDTYPSLVLMRRQRALQLQLELADALVAALGYYQLPYADLELSHNEAAIGPEGARGRVARMLESRGLVAAYDPYGLENDQLAAQLGLGSVSASGAGARPEAGPAQDLAQSLPKAGKKP